MLLIRIPLLGGLIRLVAARVMVGRAVSRGEVGGGGVANPDALDPAHVPSVSGGSGGDRVLAEIDQDGYLFATDPRDVLFFNGRERKLPRRRWRVEVVLRGGVVLLRKRHVRGRSSGSLGVRLWEALGLPFYNEVAAMLRLRGLPCVPQLREIDTASRTIFMEFIRGGTLRHRLAADGTPVSDLDLASDTTLSRLSDGERLLREGRLWSRLPEPYLRAKLADLVVEMYRRGVAPVDVHLANIVVGRDTGRPYWVDFELARLRLGPGWARRVVEHRRLADEVLGLGLSPTADPVRTDRVRTVA